MITTTRTYGSMVICDRHSQQQQSKIIILHVKLSNRCFPYKHLEPVRLNYFPVINTLIKIAVRKGNASPGISYQLGVIL